MKQNILLIMPNFFDYPQIISKELEGMGYEVDYFDDRPSTSGIVKAIIRVNRNMISRYIKNYFDKIMSTVQSKKYDIVFLISGQSLSFSEEMILQIKKAQKTAKFILYQWDSLKNFPYIQKMEKYFDKCYSFDRKDVEENPKLNFFDAALDCRYEKIGKSSKKNYKYDFCFIGTAHPKKYKFIREMSKQLKNIYPKQYIYFFFPSLIVFFYRKVMNKELRKAHLQEFHFKPLSGEELESIYKESKCILDSAQDGQLGLTIRIFEALGAKKKIITTNEDIKNYDFYREENIYVYDGNGFDHSSPFLKIIIVNYQMRYMRSIP